MPRPRSYLMHDERASGGRLEEVDTVGCVHCQTQLRITRTTREGGWCFPCAAPICVACARTGRCEPFLRKVEQKLARERFARAVGVEG